jgi:hypothetical protein
MLRCRVILQLLVLSMHLIILRSAAGHGISLAKFFEKVYSNNKEQGIGKVAFVTWYRRTQQSCNHEVSTIRIIYESILPKGTARQNVRHTQWREERFHAAELLQPISLRAEHSTLSSIPNAFSSLNEGASDSVSLIALLQVSRFDNVNYSKKKASEITHPSTN